MAVPIMISRYNAEKLLVREFNKLFHVDLLRREMNLKFKRVFFDVVLRLVFAPKKRRSNRRERKFPQQFKSVND